MKITANTKAIVSNTNKAHYGHYRPQCGAGASGRSTWKASTDYRKFATESTTIEGWATELVAAGYELCSKCFKNVVVA
jgi:hypothetical protein